MLPPEFTPLTALMWLAAAAGVLHTLAGPDHYAPLIAVGRARDWGARRAAVVAAALGLAHCLVSVTIAVALVLLAVAQTPVWLDGLATVAAWTMIAAGIALGIRGWRRRGDHRARAARPALTLLSLAFLVGPCEWLIPVAVAAGTMHGAFGAVQVGAVYTVCTVATMVAATVVGLFGWRRMVAVGCASIGRASIGRASIGRASIGRASIGRGSPGHGALGHGAAGHGAAGRGAAERGDWLAAFTTTACGALMLFGM